MPTTVKIQTIERRGEDTVIALVQFLYTGTFTDSVTVEVNVFRPQSVADITNAINARGASEKLRLQSAPIIDSLLLSVPTEFDIP